MTITWELVQYAASICNNQRNMFDIGAEILNLRKKVEEIKRIRDTYEISNRATTSGGGGRGGGEQSGALNVRELRRTTSYADADKLCVGFEDDRSQLITELLKEEPRRSIVSVYGMGGLGKTTLARSLYNCSEIISHFPSRAWICVSQEYNTEDLLRSVFKSFKKGCSNDERLMLEKSNVEDLERDLRKLLRDERYMVVVDDVWHKEAWESLKKAFPDCGKGSRVVVTTRSKDVATGMDERCYPHNLRFLNPTESWNLFLSKIFHGQEQDNWCSPAMQDLGREMVAKCGGLPLAVVVLGGLLSHKQNLGEWQKVKEHIWTVIEKDSIAISYLLSLSYGYLSRELKQCFLYLGTFPEDYIIDAEQLTYLWMGEQFIPFGENMEDVAESYLNELINRSLIQVATRHWDKTAKCKIHDLLRDLAIQKAPEDFLLIYNPNANPSSLVQQKRHVVHTHFQNYLSDDHSNKSLRSLVVRNLVSLHHETPRLFDTISENYNYLWLLKLEGTYGVQYKLPDIFGNLVHLKYLGLFGIFTGVSLPPSIGKLKSLQTLEVYPNGSGCELPTEISALKSLRHLICPINGTAEIGCLSSLRVLKNIKYEHWAAIKKENLVNLRDLVIEDIHQINGKPYILEPFTNFKKLHTLVLDCILNTILPMDFLSTIQNVRTMWLSGKINMLPPITKWPMSITLLFLSNSELGEDSILILGMLPNLSRLDWDGSYLSATMIFAPNSFPQLRTLNLFFLHNLEKLVLGEGAMPRIKRLHVRGCEKLVIPDKLASVLHSGEEGLDYSTHPHAHIVRHGRPR